MKKIYLILLLLFVNLISRAQISITQSDMPHPGDSARYTNAALNLFINYAATGANHTWDFHNLRAASQGLEQYQSVSSTNFVYALIYLNIPFNPNRATVASNTTEAPTNPLIPLTNPYNFYFLNSSQYRQSGFGAEIAGFPVPIPFNNKDVIYNLPLNFGINDTSYSDWNINIPGTGFMGYSQTRINNADGWGTLITPSDTFDVLRVKTTRAQRDTFAVDSLGGFGIDRLLVNEYKWLANGEIIPVMQITTQTIFGFEVVTDILFRDDFIRIETDPLSAAVYCAGSSITVPYTKYGTFNGPGLFSPANVFTAQLSDSSGSFANPVNIGSVTSTQSGNIAANIPAGTLPGDHYRIRVISSNLPVTGSDNGSDIIIINNTPVINAINVSGPLNFCTPGSVTLSIDTGSYYSYQWFNNGVAINGEVAPDYTAAASGVYTVQVTNPCGAVTSGSITVTVDSLPSVSIINSGSSFPCQGDTVILTSATVNAISLQWQLNGIDITGETGADLIVTQDGNYTLAATNACGTTLSGAINILFNSPPAAPVITGGANSLCTGDSVLLTGSAVSGSTLQWQWNGIDITGATDSVLYAYAGGDFTLIATNLCGSASSAVFSIMLNSLPATPVVNASSLSVCAGDSILLTATGTTGYALQWQLDGIDLPGATDSVLYVSVSGNYTISATNLCGTSLSATTTITINPLPAAPVITQGFDTLYASGTGPNQWYLNGVLIPGATLSYYVVTQNGNYTVMITDTNGCTNISAIFNYTSVGMQEQSVTGIHIYPNPVSGSYLNFTWDKKGSINGISIENMLGQQISSYTNLSNQSKLSVNVNNLPSGVYNLHCFTSKTDFNFKFIKE
ncbi:MAG TPA: T9SS type A sorting domain-containing protein [Bacteroidia bacterium]|nr:T9SS type A sorting domain-containing protein [Bacteroidia bacterium]